jgi:pentapeptide repeat protein
LAHEHVEEHYGGATPATLGARTTTLRPSRQLFYEIAFLLLALLVVGFGVSFLLDRDTQTAGATLIAAIVVAVGTFRTIQVTRQGQIADRFTKAIEQLGKNDLDIRLGGIYALERVAQDSKRDHEAVMEVLTAFVRCHAPWPRRSDEPLAEKETAELANAVQAVIAVLGRRWVEHDRHDLDLSAADLHGMKFGKGDFRRSILLGTNLEGTDLERPDREALLEGAHYDGNTVPPHGVDLAADYGAHRVDGPISTCQACKQASGIVLSEVQS